MTLEDVELIVRTMADVALENERYFSDLDAVMGDADFGVSLADGFRAVLKGWDSHDRTSITSFLMKISTIILANTGGCSGPIWGTLFMRCAMGAKGKTDLTLPDIIAMLRSAIEGIKARGGAEIGDKTLLDALDPAVRAMEEWPAPKDLLGAFQAGADAATAAIEGTRGWVARRGRQSFTGERSVGTLDPGIVAVATMMQAIVKKLKERA
ncbi:MAG TPA: dihydroxyacetone kinase subunit L [Firmicutes bacterium]|nr:dihydroxyacetone kinase subunit L [Bacillota bacterium]